MGFRASFPPDLCIWHMTHGTGAAPVSYRMPNVSFHEVEAFEAFCDAAHPVQRFLSRSSLEKSAYVGRRSTPRLGFRDPSFKSASFAVTSYPGALGMNSTDSNGTHKGSSDVPAPSSEQLEVAFERSPYWSTLHVEKATSAIIAKPNL